MLTKKVFKRIFLPLLASIILITFYVRYIKYNTIYAAKKLNVILITIDALRADHLGCYGYQRNTTPYIDKLSKEGVVFLNSFVTGPGTVYSLAALLTGRYLQIGEDYLFFDNILDEEFITLAEYLKGAGYYTAAFVNNGNLEIGKGFERGFEIYENYSRDAKDMTDRVNKFLNNYSGNKPFFIWMHYLEPHVPYSPHEKYFKIFLSDRLYKQNDKMLKLSPAFIAGPYISEGYIPEAAFHHEQYNLNHYIACYDSEIRYADFQIGRLLKNIKDNTLVILTADHGESLGEHNYYFTHEESVYDAVLHVPLIIKDNQHFRGGRIIPSVVSSVDIVPTIIGRINPTRYSSNKNNFDGVDLEKVIEYKDIKREYIYSYAPFAYTIRGVKENIKYILNLDGREELYFAPEENTNRINDDLLGTISIQEKLKEGLKTWRKGYPVRADINRKKTVLDKETQESLRSLGYMQ